MYNNSVITIEKENHQTHLRPIDRICRLYKQVQANRLVHVIVVCLFLLINSDILLVKGSDLQHNINKLVQNDQQTVKV